MGAVTCYEQVKEHLRIQIEIDNIDMKFDRLLGKMHNWLMFNKSTCNII